MDKPLSRPARQALAHDLAAIIAHVGHAPVDGVDFPQFVADLITGVFDAMVDATSKQMRAYAELLRTVSSSLDDFADDPERTRHAYQSLAQRYPDLVDATLAPKPEGRSTVVRMLMGINRIIVTDGEIKAH